MGSRKSVSTKYFDYTCPDLDRIMSRLNSDIINQLPDDAGSDMIDAIENLISAAASDIKTAVTYPGREAFDTAIQDYEMRIDELLEKLES